MQQNDGIGKTEEPQTAIIPILGFISVVYTNMKRQISATCETHVVLKETDKGMLQSSQLLPTSHAFKGSLCSGTLQG